MPRKVNYGLDYDDDDYQDYDDYEEYEDEEYEGDNNNYEVKVEAAIENQEIVEAGLWCCSICTFDNDESVSCCDMCGVLRVPPPSRGSNIDKKAGGINIGNEAAVSDFGKKSGNSTLNKKAGGSNIDKKAGVSVIDKKAGVSVIDKKAGISVIDKKSVGGDTCKEYGVSKLAKGLFASVPHQKPKIALDSLPQNSFDLTGGGRRCHDSQNIEQDSHVLNRGLNAPRSRRRTTIAPFKFDIPSPDDANRLHAMKKGAPPGFAATTAKSSSMQFDFDVGLGGHGTPPEENNVNTTSNVLKDIEIVEGPLASEISDSSPSRKLKSAVDSMREHNSGANGEKLESVAHGLEKMSLGSKPGSSKAVLRKSLAEYKPESWMLPKEDGSVKTQLNLAIVGHVDSGKSTLSGRLLYLLGQISQKQMHKYERDARQQGKGSFAYAWAMDESAEERERGITMTVAVAYFDTKRYHVVVLDSPGHKDFVPNMISGATQADAAILVIDASMGAYETGMDSIGGQSREHAQLIRSFGVEQIIVAINKMDVVAYSEERFEIIKQQVGSFLRQCGFKESFIYWIPVSAMENQNLVVSVSDARLNSWYKGPHLLDAIDTFQPPRRDYEKPWLMPICDVVKTPSMAQISACGKLEAGALRSGCKVLVMPVGDIATVKSIASNSEPCTIARAGQNVAVVLQGIDFGHVKAGGVLCHPDFPVRVASHLELKILVLDLKIPILVGSSVEFQIHHAKEAARIVKIVSLLDSKTGKETKRVPRHLLSKQSAVIEVALQGEVCVEDFSTHKALGRAFLRQSGRTIAVGVVTKVLEGQK